MRILGIDPGLRTTGFGVIDVAGSDLAYVASGTISTTHLEKGRLPERLKVLFDGLVEVSTRYQPDCASVEIVFVNLNPQSTLLLGQARGACITALVSRQLPVAESAACWPCPACPGPTPPTRWAWPSPMPMPPKPWPGWPRPTACWVLAVASTRRGAAVSCMGGWRRSE